MTDLASLTKVLKEDLDKAVENFNKIKEEDQKTLDLVVSTYRENYKFPWWYRKKTISRLKGLSNQEFMYVRDNPLHGKAFWQLVNSCVDKNLVDESYKYTLGNGGAKWREVALRLQESGCDEHYVSDGVLDWITTFKEIKQES